MPARLRKSSNDKIYFWIKINSDLLLKFLAFLRRLHSPNPGQVGGVPSPVSAIDGPNE